MTDIDFILAICGGSGGITILVSTVTEFVKEAIRRRQDRLEKRDFKSFVDNMETIEDYIVDLYEDKEITKAMAIKKIAELIEEKKMNLIRKDDYLKHAKWQWEKLEQADGVNRS